MRKSACSLILLLLTLRGGLAQNELGRFPTKVVGGRLVVLCDLASSTRRVPVHLFVELGSKDTLFLHARAARDLGFESGVTATLNVPGFKVDDLTPRLGGSRLHSSYTTRFAPELGEVACIGTLGLGFFEKFHTTFRLDEGYIAFAPREEEVEEDFVWKDGSHPLERRGGRLWVEVEYEGGGKGHMALETRRHDTLVDEALCRRLKHPAGDLSAARVGNLELTRRVALRPESPGLFHPDGVFGVLGLNLLLQCRMSLDLVNSRITLEATRPAKFPASDLAFFKARASGNPRELESFLEAFSNARLAGEAGDLLLNMRLKDLSHTQDPAAVIRALTLRHGTVAGDRRATEALQIMDRLERERADQQFVIKAGELGIQDGRDDRDALAIYRIHGRLGRIHLEAGRDDPAFKHLFSAVFGMREDGPANLDLGRFYEKKKHYRRAFSRYVQAVIKEESAEAALEGMKRTQKKMGRGESMGIETIEKLIEGRIPGYRVGHQYKPTDAAAAAGRRVLLELVTGAHCKPCLAADLAFEALQSHYTADYLTLVQYHVNIPIPEPLANTVSGNLARRLGAASAPQAFINGVSPNLGGGLEDRREERFDQYRALINRALEQPAAHRIEAEAQVRGGTVFGKVTLSGPALEGSPRVQILLVERSVLFPGRNRIVIHRMVVRDALTRTAGGVPWRPVLDTMVVPFEKPLEETESALNDRLDHIEMQTGRTFSMWPTQLDPRQLSLVVILRDYNRKVVYQSLVVPVKQVEEESH